MELQNKTNLFNFENDQPFNCRSFAFMKLYNRIRCVSLFFIPLLLCIGCERARTNNGKTVDEKTGYNTIEGISENSSRLLESIDSIIAVRHKGDKLRTARISKVKQQRKLAKNDTVAYNIDKELYDLYNGFRQDSALAVATDRLDLAIRIGDTEKISVSKVLKAQSLMNIGENAFALSLLESMNKSMVSDNVRNQMNSVYLGVYSSLAKSMPDESQSDTYTQKAAAYRDTIISTLTPKSVGHRYLTAQKLRDNGDLKGAMEILEEGTDTPEFLENAAFQCGYGMFYIESGERHKAVERLARAARLDLKDGKKEYVALILLASLLYEEGDIERSFEYLKCALEDAGFSHATLRAQEIFDILPVIDGAYRSYQDMEKDRIRREVRIYIGISLFLLLAIAALWFQFRRISGMKKLLALSNEELQEKTERLTAMDNAKIHLIESLLKLHSSNIANQKKYRRDLLRLMKGGQYERVSDRLNSDTLDNSEIKLFYEMFDSTFLSIFPNFIQEVNQYLIQPYSTVSPDSFTPELRIMALMKFGYTSATDISSILQYSSQTVYNYRSSIRKMLNCPWDDFAKAILIGS